MTARELVGVISEVELTARVVGVPGERGPEPCGRPTAIPPHPIHIYRHPLPREPRSEAMGKLESVA